MTLDLDALAALHAVAPALTLIHEIMRDQGGARAWSPEGEAFYDACKQHAPALIAAARERGGLAAERDMLVKERDMLRAQLTQTQGWRDRLWREAGHHAEMAHKLADAVERSGGRITPKVRRAIDETRAVNVMTPNYGRLYHALARAVRAQASAQAAATRSDSASWVDFVTADVLAALEEVGDGTE